jgi:flagellar biosynthesis protein FlhG
MYKEKNMNDSKSIAILSPKGGSGKTFIAVAIAQILDHHKIKTILVDTDMATAGMTFYMATELVKSISKGLVDIIFSKKVGIDSIGYFIRKYTQKISGLSFVKFFGLGSPRKIRDGLNEVTLPSEIQLTLEMLNSWLNEDRGQWMIVDCRGGIDEENIAVCQAVDDILIVTEPDTTSFQAIENLVNTLSEFRLDHKIVGFIINKVFIDPTSVELLTSQVVRTRHLSSIPLDIEAARHFLVGKLPPRNSTFNTHVWYALKNAYPAIIENPPEKVWSKSDYKNLIMMKRETRILDSAFVFYILVLTVLYLAVKDYKGLDVESLIFMGIAMLGVISNLEFLQNKFIDVIRIVRDRLEN